MTRHSEKIILRAHVKQNGGDIIVSPLPGDRKERAWSPETLYIIQIKEFKPGRTLDQNALMWWTYRKEAELLNNGYMGPEAITPEELYEQDLQRFTDAVVVSVIPEAVNTLKNHFRIVNPLATVFVKGKKHIKCECWMGSSSFDKEQMSRWIEYRFRRLAEYGYDAEADFYYKQWRGGKHGNKKT